MRCHGQYYLMQIIKKTIKVVNSENKTKSFVHKKGSVDTTDLQREVFCYFQHVGNSFV